MSGLLKTKRLVWAVIFALVTGVALLSYLSSSRYVAAVQAVEHTLAVELSINGALALLTEAETGQRGYMLTGDPQFLEHYEKARRDIPALLARLAAKIQADAAQAARLSALGLLIEQRYEMFEATLKLRQAGLSGASPFLQRGKVIMAEIRAHCAAMLEHEDRLLTQRKREAAAAKLTASWGVGIGSLVTVVLSLLSMLTVHRDVQELKRAGEELAASEEHYRLLAQQGSDLVRLISFDGVTTYVSPSVERRLGYGVEEFLALPPFSLVHPDDLQRARELLAEVRSGETESGTTTYRLRHKSGEYRWFETEWLLRRDERGAPRDIHMTGRDVTERREAERQVSAYADELRSLSLCDELTGLYNRRGFLEIAAHAQRQAVRDARAAALIFVDLNGMKRINDELGHEAGDAALIDTAHVLSAAMRASDVVARLGGDEFAVFALDFAAAELDALRQRLHRLTDARTTELGRPFRLSMSVGAAYMTAESRATINDLLDAADAAMYEQKRARRAAGVSAPPPASSRKQTSC